MAAGSTQVDFSIGYVLNLNANVDSGTAANPISYTGWQKPGDSRTAQLLGGLPLPAASFVPASQIAPSSAPTLNSAVLAVDLTKILGGKWFGSSTMAKLLGNLVSGVGTTNCQGGNMAELFVNKVPMNLAQYPNQPWKNGKPQFGNPAFTNWLAAAKPVYPSPMPYPIPIPTTFWFIPYAFPDPAPVPYPTYQYAASSTAPPMPPAIINTWTKPTLPIPAAVQAVYDRITTWAQEAKPFIHTYGGNEWSDYWIGIQPGSVKGLGTSYPLSPGSYLNGYPAVSATLMSAAPYGISTNARFRAVNILRELDEMGEYYLDTANGILYYWPIAPLADNQAYLSISPAIIQQTNSAQNVQYVTFSNLEVHYAKGTAISLTGNYLTLKQLNGNSHSKSALSITGYNNLVSQNSISYTGCQAIMVGGGDSRILTPSKSVVDSNVVSYFGRLSRTYMPGVRFNGVGVTISNNDIGFGPSAGIYGGGNDCLFDSNYLHDLVLESSDMGAFYTGQSWVRRGNVLNNNTFENIRNVVTPFLRTRSAIGVYLDDLMAAVTVTNNKFINVQKGVNVNGGMQHVMTGNSFVNVDLAFRLTDSGLTTSIQKAHCVPPNGDYIPQLASVNYQNPPYSKYPGLSTMMDRDLCVPWDHVYQNNVYCSIDKTRIKDLSQLPTYPWLYSAPAFPVYGIGQQFRDFTDSNIASWNGVFSGNNEGYGCPMTTTPPSFPSPPSAYPSSQKKIAPISPAPASPYTADYVGTSFKQISGNDEESAETKRVSSFAASPLPSPSPRNKRQLRRTNKSA